MDGFLHGATEEMHAVDFVKVEGHRMVRKEGGLLVFDLLEYFWAVYNEEGGPGGGDAGGVLPGKDGHNGKAVDLLVGNGCVINVFDVHEYGEDVHAVGVILVWVTTMVLDGIGEEF
eukprot:8321749-Ditylum_brightwellii.AAC.1